jgi:hypothetical protein
MTHEIATGWLLLVISLPTSSATGRMRIWRALKSLGCVALRDGAYLLPSGPGRAEALRELGDECVREGGSSWLMTVTPDSPDDDVAYRQLFDRSAQYAELRKSWKSENRGLRSLSMTDCARLKRRLEKDFDALRASDFFPSEASVEAEAAWIDFSKRIDASCRPTSPMKPRAACRSSTLTRYRGRTWATRRRPLGRPVDERLADPPLHRPDARFRWLAKPSDCPKSALGFDFDGATFTHVGDRVTFETLLASFGLGDDAALARLATIVHAPRRRRRAGCRGHRLRGVMAGARERIADDDALLAEMSNVLDSLYAHFGRDAQRGADKGNADEPGLARVGCGAGAAFHP